MEYLNGFENFQTSSSKTRYFEKCSTSTKKKFHSKNCEPKMFWWNFVPIFFHPRRPSLSASVAILNSLSLYLYNFQFFLTNFLKNVLELDPNAEVTSSHFAQIVCFWLLFNVLSNFWHFFEVTLECRLNYKGAHSCTFSAHKLWAIILSNGFSSKIICIKNLLTKRIFDYENNFDEKSLSSN